MFQIFSLLLLLMFDMNKQKPTSKKNYPKMDESPKEFLSIKKTQLA